MNPCRNCDAPTDHPWEVCPKCFRDPETNNCEKCGTHLSGVPYPYVCGECMIRGSTSQCDMDELEARRQDVMRALGEPVASASTWDETLSLVEDVRLRGETATEWCNSASRYRQERDIAISALEAAKGDTRGWRELVRDLQTVRELHARLLESYNDKDKKLIETEHLLTLAMREGLTAVNDAKRSDP